MLTYSPMLDEQLIGQLPSLSAPGETGDVMTVDLYLYRAPEPIEPGELLPFYVYLPPEEYIAHDWHVSSRAVPGHTGYRFHVNRPSLSLPEPLWYHLVATLIHFYPSVYILFLSFGGGGRGTPPSDPSDADTIRQIFDDLHRFPQDWWRVT